ncbi:hypothetical protein BX661DRAFT_86628 [Kickxella alabastrina]|uniref:uncharacterized protein n=1 Tax=Kickxella alabastrina TaxID=61397 RepID=UPI00221EFA10|nr:uncharacterized protein BX661DRAFT_86628 [Kickxella alabastrina]KAI7831998.1 hypothetical protein BX661DRAFT_86628 [Kickxella alabastrina]
MHPPLHPIRWLDLFFKVQKTRIVPEQHRFLFVFCRKQRSSECSPTPCRINQSLPPSWFSILPSPSLDLFTLVILFLTIQTILYIIYRL